MTHPLRFGMKLSGQDTTIEALGPSGALPTKLASITCGTSTTSLRLALVDQTGRQIFMLDPPRGDDAGGQVGGSPSRPSKRREGAQVIVPRDN